MAEDSSNRFTEIIKELRPHAVWHVVLYSVETLLIPTSYVIVSVVRRATWDLWVALMLFVLSAIVLWLRSRKNNSTDVQAPQQLQIARAATEISPVAGIPTLSSLLGMNTSPTFDSKMFFANAYFSTITAETEKNIRIAAQQVSPGDKEGFYARLIGVGVVSYHHDITRLTIYGSQARCLYELNSVAAVIPISKIKEFYDEAVPRYPAMYPKYTFEEWLDYMQQRMIVVKYPSEMIEITFHGKDLIKYLAHIGLDIRERAF